MSEEKKNYIQGKELSDDALEQVAGGDEHCAGWDTSITDYTKCCCWNGFGNAFCGSAANHCSAIGCPRYNATFR